MYEIVYTNRMNHDWLLMYRIFENELILSATATGSHSDLFGK
ncbi:type II toxin-antitoxin system YafQ family toxin [uncultured Treponema sp.]|nr:type II toxin-antitoxin system YafQ family toxin [uncultured Treponema sp.]